MAVEAFRNLILSMNQAHGGSKGPQREIAPGSPCHAAAHPETCNTFSTMAGVSQRANSSMLKSQ